MKDQIDIQLGSNFYNELYDQMDIDGDGLNDFFNAALEEDAVYSQITLQAELPLPNDWQINTQFFIYNLMDYSLINYTFSNVSVTLPLATIDMNEVINEDGDYFTPGFGSSMGTLSQKSILFGIEKYMLDNNLKSTFTTFFDLDKGNGKLMSLELEYEISNDMNLLFGSTKIYGDSSVQPKSDFDLGYTFNLMENFSHNRIQLNYYF